MTAAKRRETNAPMSITPKNGNAARRPPPPRVRMRLLTSNASTEIVNGEVSIEYVKMSKRLE